MSKGKLKLTGVDGKELVGKCPAVAGATPTGSMVMVELLKPDEVVRTNIHLTEAHTPTGGPQAYILDVGPKVPDDYGFRVGDRVVLTGNFNLSIFTPLPPINNPSGREVVCCEPTAIKAVLIEE